MIGSPRQTPRATRCGAPPRGVGIAVFTLVCASVAGLRAQPAAPDPTAPAAGPGAAASATRPEAAAPQMSAPAPTLRPPQLLDRTHAALPAETPGGAAFMLQLEIDATGQVVRADVLEASDTELAGAVRGAVLQFRFRPATRDGVPVGATIRYRHVIPSSIPPSKAEPAATPGEGTIEVTVRGQAEAARLAESAEAVSVVVLGEGPDAPSDSAALVGRQEGITVRRGGGLGSTARLSMNGLTDQQVRAFMDGVPLSFSGFPFGLASVPTALATRVDVYRGVVPPRLGADALGGAVELVTERRLERPLSGAASYEAGAFDTHRLHGRVAAAPEGSPLRLQVEGFIDRSENDYGFSLPVPQRNGQLSEQRVYKRNARYAGQGLLAEASLVDLPLADRLSLRGHFTDFTRGVPHNQFATVPYGEVEQGARSLGVQGAYEATLGPATVHVRAGFTQRTLSLIDTSTCTYNWFGQCVAQTEPGEITARAFKQEIDQPLAYARARAEFAINANHGVEISLAPTWVARSGRDEALQALGLADDLELDRSLVSLVSGLRYRVSLWEDALRMHVFGKHYAASLDAAEYLLDGTVRSVDRAMGTPGVGAGLRLRAYEDIVVVKASYEWATRLPSPDELFGDGLFTEDNLGLSPERSHNGNVSLHVTGGARSWGDLSGEVGGVVRMADAMIVRVVGADVSRFENLGTARILGIQGRVAYATPKRFLLISANLTYDDLRNTSREGAFARTEGQRLPNRPYLYGGASLGTELSNVWSGGDTLALSVRGDFVERYYFGWSGDATSADKLEIPAQGQWGAAVTYAVQLDKRRLTFGVRVQNLFDAQVFDSLGVALPGRAAYARVAVEL